MMLVYGTSYAALIFCGQILLGGFCRFMGTVRSRGIDASITRLDVGSIVTAMIESVR